MMKLKLIPKVICTRLQLPTPQKKPRRILDESSVTSEASIVTDSAKCHDRKLKLIPRVICTSLKLPTLPKKPFVKRRRILLATPPMHKPKRIKISMIKYI